MMKKFIFKTLCLCTCLVAFTYLSHGQGYCIPISEYGCDDGDQINTFILNGESGTSINDINTGCSDDGYDDRTSESVSLAQTANYTATISSGYDADVAKVWIDFNDDGNFDNGESVGFSEEVDDGAGGPLSISIPASAALGSHRMRVAVVDYYGDMEELDACNPEDVEGEAQWYFGEIHDYTVTIVGPATCESPQNLAIAITTATATVSWDGVGTYVVEYGPEGYTPGTTNTAGASGTLVSASATSPSSISLAGLASGTYYVYVRKNCTSASNGYSVNGMVTFSPPVPHDLPSDAATIVVDAPCAGLYNNVGASVVSGEPGAGCMGIDENYATVWFKFTAPPSGAVKISTDHEGNTLENTRIALFEVGNPTDFITFTSIACDENNGVVNDYSSIIYATGLISGTTYYIVVDKDYSFTEEGDFCLTVNSLTDDMISTTGNACEENSYGEGAISYDGWTSLVDFEGKLINNIRVSGQLFEDYFCTPTLTVTNGATRTDGVGNSYLNRNFFFDGFAEDEDFEEIDLNYDLQLFFTQAELDALGADLSTLNVTHVPGDECSGDFIGTGDQTALLTSASGSSDGANWIQITTPGFSNFYVMSGAEPLPINLKDIAAKNVGAYNAINWNTTSSDRGDKFELQRSADGKKFDPIATIPATTTQFDYVYNDQNPINGINYYRLHLINNDGTTSYSKVVNATVSGKELSIEVFPNPVNDEVTIKANGIVNGSGVLLLTDAVGRVINKAGISSGGVATFNTSNLAQGLYLIRFSDDITHQVIKINKK